LNEEIESVDPGDTGAGSAGVDPGNADPEQFTTDLTDEETLDANSAVEEAIKTLPTENEGVL
jgi:hypothetical protein